ncbi:hypothetical protein ASPWEDRAFT_28985 [Aspergillus wentii DTO 134E9]|uniref:FHA domain-containing protein n=1 Tax=Aspergillus wentii DTO 134E9 TaxID=1073089 RepID=A0A1L9RFV2_ASPWE|nr:uncharacterized protein ASPWEDRAFT_28985 [Aspergillus wentii DTO 134E9]OJJ33790.1 hypothetical protein ASPWEDRAFT_28985 [Aspergillus wentii DTO 134E9]
MEPQRQASVTLHPLFQPDSLPFRSLTFFTDSDSFNIGRASKREAKNLAPAHHNAWFDSRVMSRNHAKLGVSMDKQHVYIRDGGSMHGTFVNDKRIPVGMDVALKNNDILTFGTEVNRGTETFAPLRIRFESEWFGYGDDKVLALKQASNTFCVPDDDDDVVEVGPAKSSTTETYGIYIDSDISDTENNPHRENSTPATSPLIKDMPLNLEETKIGKDSSSTSPEKGSSGTTADHSSGTQKSPIVLDEEQRLVTPRMTPPVASAPADSANESDDQSDFIIKSPGHRRFGEFPVEDDSDEQSDKWDGDEEGVGLEDDSADQSPYEFDADESDEENNSVISTDLPRLALFGGPYDTSSEIEDASSHFDISDEEFQSASNPKQKAAESDAMPLPSADRVDTSAPDDFNSTLQPQSADQASGRFSEPSYKPSPLLPDWDTISKSVAAASPERRLFPLHSFHENGYIPATEEWKPQNTSNTASILPASSPYGPPQDFFSAPAPYTDGPFVNSRPLPMPLGIGICRGVPGLSHARDDTKNRMATEVSTQAEEHSFLEQSLDTPQDERRSKTRVSIADIVDTSLETPDIQKAPVKRKAAEMEMDSFASDAAATNNFASCAESNPPDTKQPLEESIDETFSQDAQPQVLIGDLKDSSTQLTDACSVDESKSDKGDTFENERPSKRAKTTHEPSSGGFARHAATALVGAVVGGLGTIAVLASLPPDYFV